ncbi:AAC(3) family N-acetyltransferase [Halalkalibacillus sediminis]|uniref:Aminoglycoside N(3)-acetyltransferase n=2 Tax=Halalkalibacillus sediminis TaxID=2018042 RepID=A0A2I0QTG5_9BACI|nr:AAC(3) family N-acetyltransferase [Halalkalibacillus sediminis]
MKEVIQIMERPNTLRSLEIELKEMGIKNGMTVLVHSSLSKLGWVSGGSQAVIQALMNVLTEEGTLVMPSQSADLSDPSEWENPPVPESWWPIIREEMPAFDAEKTPTRQMGTIAEAFRTYPDVKRSSHPTCSFAAWGKNRDEIIGQHELAYGLGEGSPLKKLNDLDAHVLFLGTSYETNTSFHLGEYRAPGAKIEKEGSPIIENGKRAWKVYEEIEMKEDLFEEVGKAFEKDHPVKQGKMGLADSKLFKVRDAVDFSEKWFTKHRQEN